MLVCEKAIRAHRRTIRPDQRPVTAEPSRGGPATGSARAGRAFAERWRFHVAPRRRHPRDAASGHVSDFGTGTNRFAFATLQVVETPEALPFRALRSYLADDGDSLQARQHAPGSPGEFSVTATCPGSRWTLPCFDPGSAPARRLVKLTPHILGAPSSFAPLVQEIELSCDERPDGSNPTPPPDAAPPPAPAPVPPPTSVDNPSDSPAACAFAASSPPRRAAGFVLGLLLLGLLLRRRS
jgi:hypothetical protein